MIESHITTIGIIVKTSFSSFSFLGFTDTIIQIATTVTIFDKNVVIVVEKENSFKITILIIYTIKEIKAETVVPIAKRRNSFNWFFSSPKADTLSNLAHK